SSSSAASYVFKSQDEFVSEATRVAKLPLIIQYMEEGRLVEMTGDACNDYQALALAEVAVAIKSGKQAGK
ncbi:hypothetical protein ACVGWI_04195, partial [Enterobacter hormaechei]